MSGMELCVATIMKIQSLFKERDIFLRAHLWIIDVLGNNSCYLNNVNFL